LGNLKRKTRKEEGRGKETGKKKTSKITNHFFGVDLRSSRNSRPIEIRGQIFYDLRSSAQICGDGVWLSAEC
jgi:hypothetical protein